VRTVLSTQFDLGYVAPTATTVGVGIGWKVLLRSGTWRLTTIHRTGPDFGIAAVTLGGSAVGSIDGYSAGTVGNVVTAISGIVVAEDGVYDLVYTCGTKHASSTAFNYNLVHVTLQRTGA
jgi:hypothetical protein